MKSMKNEGVDRHKIEEEGKNFIRELLKDVPDGKLSKNESAYKRCKRKSDNLKELKDEYGNKLFPITTATEYMNFFKELVEEENLKFFKIFYKEGFSLYVYLFIINRGYELPITFDELINSYPLNADAVKDITEVKELFFDDYYKGLKEITGEIEGGYIDYFEYYLSLVKKRTEVKRGDEKHKS